MRILTLAAVFVIAACCVSACKDAPGADGRYAHLYPGRSGEGGTGLPATPYDPNRRDAVR
jgi:hypothetical protein